METRILIKQSNKDAKLDGLIIYRNGVARQVVIQTRAETRGSKWVDAQTVEEK